MVRFRMNDAKFLREFPNLFHRIGQLDVAIAAAYASGDGEITYAGLGDLPCVSAASFDEKLAAKYEKKMSAYLSASLSAKRVLPKPAFAIALTIDFGGLEETFPFEESGREEFVKAVIARERYLYRSLALWKLRNQL